MTRTHARFAPVLAAAMAASGCATTHLSGEYRPFVGETTKAATEKDSKEGSVSEKERLGDHSRWLFLWGLIDTRDYDADKDLAVAGPGHVVRDLEIEDHQSVLGVLLWIITAGTVNHHTVVLKGRSVAPEATMPSGAPAH